MDKVAGMVAKMADDKKNVLDWHVVEHGGQHGVHHVSRQKKLFLADMELDIVADKEVDKVAGPNLTRLANLLSFTSLLWIQYFSRPIGDHMTK